MTRPLVIALADPDPATRVEAQALLTRLGHVVAAVADAAALQALLGAVPTRLDATVCHLALLSPGTGVPAAAGRLTLTADAWSPERVAHAAALGGFRLTRPVLPLALLAALPLRREATAGPGDAAVDPRPEPGFRPTGPIPRTPPTRCRGSPQPCRPQRAGRPARLR